MKFKNRKQRFTFSLIVNSFTILSILFFAPLDLYLGNMVNFAFPFSSIWWVLLLVSSGLILIISSIETFLPDLLSFVSNLIIFILGMCCYIQSAFLNGNMTSLADGRIKYSSSIVDSNIIIWVLIAVLVLVGALLLRKFKKINIVKVGLEFICASLIVMQSVALISVLVSTDMNRYNRTEYFSNEKEFELSSNNNVIVFILDTCDDDLFVDPLLEKEPQIFDELKGFTYYPNATSTYSRTYPAVPYLLTKEMCYFDEPYYQYIDEAYENSEYLSDLKNTGADLRIFTFDQYLGRTGNQYFANVKKNDQKVKVKTAPTFLKKMLKISLYRNMPYVCKNRFYYDNEEINKIFAPNDSAIKYDEVAFNKYLTDNGLTVSNNYSASYRFYHLAGTHPGNYWDADLNYKKGATPEESLKGDLKLIKEYIEQMKALGVYDRSTIIITADHGNSGGGHKEILLQQKARPIMIVKPAGESDENGFRISSAPVCQEDLFPTILSSLGSSNSSSYGTAINEIPENYDRDRYYYYTGLFTDIDGEVALIQYKIDGDARDFENWQFTGKYWDVDYSERAVSKRRMKDYSKDKPQKPKK